MGTSRAWCSIVLLIAAACGESGSQIIDAATDTAVLDGEAVPDATTVLPDAAELPDATTIIPDATTVLPDATTVIPDATTIIPDATTVLPDAMLPLDAPVSLCPVGLDDLIPATITVTTDDNTTLWLNGVLIDNVPRVWSNPQRYDVMIYAHPSRANVVAIEAGNTQNQAGRDRGTVADVRFTVDGAAQTVISDASWRATSTLTAGWHLPGFDDSAWPAAVSLGAVGIPPWGAVFSTLAPGSVAEWIWTYDSGPVAVKPTVETVYTRRAFTTSDPRCVIVSE